MKQTLTLGSRNQHKVEEIRSLLDNLPIELVSLPHDIPECVEDRETFRGNAEKKALEYARAVNGLVLADDSGLVVEALDGAPGVHSARFAGQPTNHARNNALLLEKLQGLHSNLRRAYFTTVIVLADPEGVRLCVEGRVHGRIATSLSGEKGFGYDPLFVIDEPLPYRGLTMAELDIDTKNSISHRGRALKKFLRALPAVLTEIQ